MRSEFTHAHYRKMIVALKADRRMVAYDDTFDLNGTEPLGILRHDVDFCLHEAVIMARIEQEVGISATYFLRLTGTFYNPLSARGAALVRELLTLGHKIGVQFDAAHYQSLGLSITAGVAAEAALLSAFFQTDVRMSSQHRPAMQGQAALDPASALARYSADNPALKAAPMKYISDSTAHWREGDAFQHLDSARHLHVLVHPIWWSENGDEWQACLSGAARRAAAAIEDKEEVLLARYQEVLENRFRKG